MNDKNSKGKPFVPSRKQGEERAIPVDAAGPPKVGKPPVSGNPKPPQQPPKDPSGKSDKSK
jgi:hypothetical protein